MDSMDEGDRKEGSLETYRGRIERAIAFAQANLAGDAGLEGAAAAACFSKFHFHRIFSSAMGESYAEFVRRLRLEHAATLLETRPRITITEAAMESGFSSPSVLSRLFADRFGAPPSTWREERRAIARAASRAVKPASSPGYPATLLWGSKPSGSEAAAPRAVSIDRMPAFRFASCLHIGAYGPGIAEAWERLCRWAGPRRLLGPGMRAAGVSWDNPDVCPPERCRYSACLQIPEGIEPSEDPTLLVFPARTYIVLHYSGGESGFSSAYEELYGELLPRSGFEPEDSPAIELYRGPPGGMAGFSADIALPVRPIN
jgi:AraC family transcriptional regulator